MNREGGTPKEHDARHKVRGERGPAPDPRDRNPDDAVGGEAREARFASGERGRRDARGPLCKRCEKEEGKVDLLRGRSVVKRFVPVTSVAALLLMLVFAGCGGGGQDETASSGGAGNSGADEVSVNEGEFNDEETAGEIPEKQPVKQDGAAPAEGEAQEVGGFVVEGADGVELVRVPEVSVDQESAQRYLEEVRPILNESARDVSGAFTPRARLEDGQIRLEVQEDPVREAREAAQSGLERLQGIEVPEGLEPIQEQLVGSYERALGAYDNINDAFASGDVGRLDAAVRENLPRIEQLNDVGNSVVQDLERAANGAEGSA